jgi:hypothetical protein
MVVLRFEEAPQKIRVYGGAPLPHPALPVEIARLEAKARDQS